MGAIIESTKDSDSEIEVQKLEVMLNEAKKKASAVRKAKFDGVEITRSARAPPGQPNTRIQRGNPSDKNREEPLSKPSGTERHNVTDQAHSSQKGVTAQTPQYRYVAPIEDPSLVQKVLARTLDSSITVTSRELLALSSDLRRQVKELTATKRYAVGEAKLVEVDVGTEAKSTEPDGNESVLYGDGLVAHDTLPLRVIKVNIHEVVNCEAILDQGASVCLMREDIWEKLGVPLEPDCAMTLETADTGKSSTLGTIQNTRFLIAGIELRLQVQVV